MAPIPQLILYPAYQSEWAAINSRDYFITKVELIKNPPFSSSLPQYLSIFVEDL